MVDYNRFIAERYQDDFDKQSSKNEIKEVFWTLLVAVIFCLILIGLPCVWSMIPNKWWSFVWTIVMLTISIASAVWLKKTKVFSLKVEHYENDKYINVYDGEYLATKYWSVEEISLSDRNYSSINKENNSLTGYCYLLYFGDTALEITDTEYKSLKDDTSDVVSKRKVLVMSIKEFEEKRVDTKRIVMGKK